jgi:hypothetical protein
LLVLGCNAERGRSEPVASVRPQPVPAPSAAPNAAQPATERVAPPTRRRAATSLPRPAELAPGASEEFDALALADVQQALSALDENAFATLVHDDKRVMPKNCRTWRTLRNRGFTPKNALGQQVDAGALVRCGALEFLARARPSRVTHVRNALDGAGPDTLPAIVASATSKPALRARSMAANKGMTLADFLPGARTGKSELHGRVLITEPASATSVILNAEAWGDVNADEIEDLLLSVLNSSDDGSFFDMRLVEVTRTSPGAPLSVLAVSE